MMKYKEAMKNVRRVVSGERGGAMMSYMIYY
jgi:hypothetical protein